MLIDVRTHGFELTQALLVYVRQQVQAGLGRIGRRIAAVVVRLTDINGDHGGDDKSCQIQLKLQSAKTLMAHSVHRDMYAAIGSAIEKARHAAARALERRDSVRRSRQSLRRASRV